LSDHVNEKPAEEPPANRNEEFEEGKQEHKKKQLEDEVHETHPSRADVG
jgi:hypothetical protein